MKSRIAIVVSMFMVAGSLIFIQGLQAAEKYPAKPIIFIIPNEPGASADIVARVLAKKFQDLLGRPIVVTNKPGAGSSIGNRELHDAKPDGYTIGISTVAIVTNKLEGLLPYDHRDYTILGTYQRHCPILMASTKTKRPFNTAQEVFSFAKSNPDEVILATGNRGQIWWISAMAFLNATGLKVNLVPQAGSGASTAIQVAGGHADIGIGDIASAKSQIVAGNIKVLAMLASDRVPEYPNVPTMKELGYNVAVYSSHLCLGPPKIPKEIHEKLLSVFKTAANDPEFKAFVIQNNGIPSYMLPDETVKWFDDQRTIFREIMGKAGILKEK